jgi:hypothetical protein
MTMPHDMNCWLNGEVAGRSLTTEEMHGRMCTQHAVAKQKEGYDNAGNQRFLFRCTTRLALFGVIFCRTRPFQALRVLAKSGEVHPGRKSR